MSSLNLIALVICLAAVLFRLYGAVKHQRWWLFGALASLSIGLLFSVQTFYVWVDDSLGGHNYLNLFVKAMLYAAFWMLGMAFSQLYPSRRRSRLVSGWPGLLILGIVTVATVVAFIAIPQAGSLAGLADNEGWANRVYSALGKLYPAYIAAIFLVPIWRVAATRGYLVIVRWSSAFLGIGLAGTIIGAAAQVLVIWSPTYWPFTLSSTGVYVSVVAFMVGLLLINTRRWSRFFSLSQTRSAKTEAIAEPSATPATN